MSDIHGDRTNVNGIASRTWSGPTNTCNSNNVDVCSPKIAVETLRECEEEHLAVFDAVFPFFVPGVDRHAKLLATLRMKAGSSLSVGGHTHYRSRSRERTKPSRRMRHSHSPVCRPPSQQTKSMTSSESLQQLTPQEPKGLRDFCIPLEKIRVEKLEGCH